MTKKHRRARRCPIDALERAAGSPRAAQEKKLSVCGRRTSEGTADTRGLVSGLRAALELELLRRARPLAGSELSEEAFSPAEFDGNHCGDEGERVKQNVQGEPIAPTLLLLSVR